MDADQALKVLIELGIIGEDKAEAARLALQKIKEQNDEITTSLPEGSAIWEKYKNVLSQTGEEALTTREKVHALHFGLEALGARIPELGSALRLLFNPATIGFAALSLAVEGGIDVWDKYKAKLEEVAKAQAEAMDTIIKSTQDAMDAAEKLEDALHPKGTIAQKDKEELNQKIENLRMAAAAQKEVSKANEDAELAAATTEQQKAEIKNRYKLQDSRADELTQSQIAGFQSAAAEQAQKQIAGIEAKIAAQRDQVNADNAKLQAEADEYKRQLKNLDITHDPTGSKAGELSQRITDIEAGIAARNQRFAASVDEERKNAGGLGEFANQTQSEANASQNKSNTQRATDAIVLRDQRIAELEQHLLALHTAQHETFAKLLQATGKSQAQVENILQQIISGHLDLATVVAQLHGQLGTQQNLGGA